MEINKLISAYNFNSGTTSRIKYIVIHYTGSTGDAKAQCQYFASGNKGASAHYFVGFDGAIWQSVEDKNIAWHCGASSYVHDTCRNANSLGVELCTKNSGSDTSSTSKTWYFEDATVTAAAELVKYLMNLYNVPASNVIRHYDVTGKICPNPYVYNTTSHTWTEFQNLISGTSTSSSTTSNTTSSTTIYRVRKSWSDASSQIGAYSSLENAKKACKTGYTVYDSNGNAVYTASSSSSTSTSSTTSSSKVVASVTSSSNLNVRTGPSTDYAKLAAWPQLAKGNMVDVIESYTNGWSKILIASKYYGYVKSSYLSNTCSSKKTFGTVVVTTTVTASKLNVRTKASASASKLSSWPQLSNGNAVEVYDSYSNGWSKILIASKYYGYVSSQYLKAYRSDMLGVYE